MKKRICVVTSSRADYGLLCWVMKEIEKNPRLKLIPVVTGTHLSRKFGYTAGEVLKDGFKDLIEVKISDTDTTPKGIARYMSQIVAAFSNFFSRKKMDFLILLGDRFEMLAIALAALPYNIPIGHIGGGEITEGLIDDSVRHSLTKLSHLHFVITKKCADRVRQMGEEPWRVKIVGSPRLDSKNNVRFKSKKELSKDFGINFKNKVALVIFHPVTLEVKNTAMQVDNLLKAIEELRIETVIFYPNLEVHSDIIIDKIRKFAKKHKNIKLFKPLKRNDYLSLLNAIDILIGNSSIGIVEAPSFCLPAVNIGNRQQGRDHVGNIINVDYSWKSIVKGARKGLYDKRFIRSLKNIKNPYGDGKASRRIVRILNSVDLNNFKIMKKNCFS